MKTHELKILPQYFKAVVDGSKTFEIRFNDRNYQVGDKLRLKEYESHVEYDCLNDDEILIGGYTGKEIAKEVSYILEGGQYGLEEGYCILGLKDIEIVSVEKYKEILAPFMRDLESELKGFEREFDFDFAIKNLIKRFENQKESLKTWREKYPSEF